MNDHISKLTNNKHCNSYMQRAYNKHQCFDYKILFTCTEKYLDLVEQELIDLYRGEKGFMNLMFSVRTARGEDHAWTGQKHSDKAKEKMSIAAKKKIKSK